MEQRDSFLFQFPEVAGAFVTSAVTVLPAEDLHGVLGKQGPFKHVL